MTKPTEYQWVYLFLGAQNKDIFYLIKRLNSNDYQGVFIRYPDKYPYRNAINGLQ